MDLERMAFSTINPATRATNALTSNAKPIVDGIDADIDLLIGAVSCRAQSAQLISRECAAHAPAAPGSVQVTSPLTRAAAPRRSRAN